jgi:hypothetical protein
MLFNEIAADYSEIHMKYTHTQENADILMLKQVEYIVPSELYRLTQTQILVL